MSPSKTGTSPRPESPPDDFDPKQAVSEVAAKLEPYQFAELFVSAAKTQVGIKEVLKSVVKELLKHDTETHDAVKTLVTKVHQDDWRFLWGKVGAVIGAIALVVLGAVGNALSAKYLR